MFSAVILHATVHTTRVIIDSQSEALQDHD